MKQLLFIFTLLFSVNTFAGPVLFSGLEIGMNRAEVHSKISKITKVEKGVFYSKHKTKFLKAYDADVSVVSDKSGKLNNIWINVKSSFLDSKEKPSHLDAESILVRYKAKYGNPHDISINNLGSYKSITAVWFIDNTEIRFRSSIASKNKSISIEYRKINPNGV